MAPPKKRAKTQDKEERPTPSALLSDNRAGWLVKSVKSTSQSLTSLRKADGGMSRSDAQSVELVVKGETLCVHRHVLTKNSEYFGKCLQKPWEEEHKGRIMFDNIDPNYLALFVGVAYSHSSLVPIQPPHIAENPQCRKDRTPMKDLVEVFKLCDRFVCPRMTGFMTKCLHVAISDGHRALFRAVTDEGLQKEFMKDFADGYEAFELCHPPQKELAAQLIDYFSGGIVFDMWVSNMDDLVMDRPRFVGAVSRAFATKLGELQTGRKLRRKELPALKTGNA